MTERETLDPETVAPEEIEIDAEIHCYSMSNLWPFELRSEAAVQWWNENVELTGEDGSDSPIVPIVRYVDHGRYAVPIMRAMQEDGLELDILLDGRPAQLARPWGAWGAQS